MLGNSVAVPVVRFILKNIAKNEAEKSAKNLPEGVVLSPM
jgi:hypothetical protein